jgi:hypothetical protein
MTGGGIGADYSVYRAEGPISCRTGGKASGPLPKMQMINEIGRRVMQGGSRRSVQSTPPLTGPRRRQERSSSSRTGTRYPSATLAAHARGSQSSRLQLPVRRST